MTKTCRDVQIKLLDGTNLRGSFYVGEGTAPAVVMMPGYNCLKEMFLPDTAVFLQANGISVLIYDPRGSGETALAGATEADPSSHVDDCLDAITWLASQPSVNADSIGVWGMSYSGPVALSVAAIDKRIKFVIACCPWVQYYGLDTIAAHFDIAIQDRVSRLHHGGPSASIKLYQDSKTPFLHVQGSKGAAKAEKWAKYATRLFPNYRHSTTVQSLANLAKWSPTWLLRHLTSTPAFVIVPAKDEISAPAVQLDLYRQIKAPKKLFVSETGDHFGVLSGADRDRLQQMQLTFIREAIASKVGGNVDSDGMIMSRL